MPASDPPPELPTLHPCEECGAFIEDHAYGCPALARKLDAVRAHPPVVPEPLPVCPRCGRFASHDHPVVPEPLDVERPWDQRAAFAAAERALAVPHRDDSQPCGCDECMAYGAEDEGADWYRFPTPNRIVIRALDSGDDRLAPLAKAIADHTAAEATTEPDAALAPERLADWRRWVDDPDVSDDEWCGVTRPQMRALLAAQDQQPARTEGQP